jgi:hypothetical protein
MLAHRRNVNSQFGEDGMIEYLFQKLGISDGGTCCEFGAWDGKAASNTFRLVKERDFRALYIEGDTEKYKDLLETSKEFPKITPVCEMVSNNLDLIFEQNNFPYDIDLLSIDVDSIDYEIWRDTHKVNPKIVIIEPNNAIPSWIKEPVYDSAKGANYYILEDLGRKKGYTLVCNTSNMFFVRNDLCNIETDDRIFPWHFENDLKQLIFQIAFAANIEETVCNFVNYAKNDPNHFIHKYVPAKYMDDFVTECPKYCKGVRLGFLDITMKVPM